MTTPLFPKPPPVARPQMALGNGEHGHHPLGVVAKAAASLWPAMFSRAPRRGALTAPPISSSELHTSCTPAATQSKSKAYLTQ